MDPRSKNSSRPRHGGVASNRSSATPADAGPRYTQPRIDSRIIGAVFGRVLKEMRTSRRFSQELLAERAGVDATYPSLLERGLRTPGLPVLLAVGWALEVEPTILVGKTIERLREGGML
jgi:hypothetical protein